VVAWCSASKTNRVRADGVRRVGHRLQLEGRRRRARPGEGRRESDYGFDAWATSCRASWRATSRRRRTPWVGTGKPFDADWHVENIASLIYEDLCGAVGANTRRCNLAGNVVVAGNHDNGEKCSIELSRAWESPTVDLAVRTAAPERRTPRASITNRAAHDA
jgi:hypothetical protein